MWDALCVLIFILGMWWGREKPPPPSRGGEKL